MSEETQVLNSHIGCNNIVDRTKINDIMGGVIKTIGDLLEDYCGPYGTFAMIPPDKNNPLAEPGFTKDGINIINATNFLNPIENHTKSMMAYIGKKVEQRAGDGTTSSMLISAKLIYAFREYLTKNPSINYRDFLTAYDLFIKKITAIIDTIAITVPIDDIELIKAVSYHQAMTSSHSDIVLSKLVAELMGTLPQHSWQHLIYKRETKETKDRFKVDIDDSSYSCEAYIFDNLMYNSNIGTEYSNKDVELYITSGELTSNGLEFHKVVQLIESRTVADKPLVIVVGHSVDIVVTNKIQELFQAKRKEGIDFILFKLQIIHPVINDLEALYATTGHSRKKMTDQEIVFKENIDVVYKYGTLSIYGLVNYNEDGTHPDADKPNSPVSNLLQVIDEFLKANKENKVHFQFSNIPKLAKQIANNIKCKKQGHIVIGGNGYDNKASEDVLIDVLCAVRESLTNGITLGGYKSLANAIVIAYRDVKITAEPTLEQKTLNLEKTIGYAFLDAICSMLTLMYVDRCPLKYDTLLQHTTTDIVNMYDHSFDVVSGDLVLFDKVNLLSHYNSTPIIIQPKATEIEFIKRFGEVAIKFLFTTRVLVPDGVLLKEKETSDKNSI